MNSFKERLEKFNTLIVIGILLNVFERQTDRQTEAFGGKSIKQRTKPQSTHDIPSLPSHERARAHSG